MEKEIGQKKAEWFVLTLSQSHPTEDFHQFRRIENAKINGG
jgi:hypothetical protein